ncbi:hypothetical protein PFISCL1PPCAC_16080, partial [Pristionchus fissidentatus]
LMAADIDLTDNQCLLGNLSTKIFENAPNHKDEDILSHMPSECLLKILSFLDFRSLNVMPCVSQKMFHFLLDRPSMLKEKADELKVIQ